jgi:ribosomal protein S18
VLPQMHEGRKRGTKRQKQENMRTEQGRKLLGGTNKGGIINTEYKSRRVLRSTVTEGWRIDPLRHAHAQRIAWIGWCGRVGGTWRERLDTALGRPLAVSHGRRVRQRRHFAIPRSSTATNDAANDREKDQTPDSDRHADDNRAVVVDPGPNLISEGGSRAAALIPKCMLAEVLKETRGGWSQLTF